jgi:hypothetical protein
MFIRVAGRGHASQSLKSDTLAAMDAASMIWRPSRWWRVLGVAACTLLCGCVFGYGHCLFTQPVTTMLSGKIHFRPYPAGEGIDQVPMLALDRTAYVYTPALSTSCLPANEVQLVGVSEFPPDVIENAHITVRGSLAEGASGHAHTRFLFNVLNIEPVTPLRP